MKSFLNHLVEGKNDKSIFHAIFMAGGPGSGKSYVVGQLGLESLNFKEINSDSALEKAMRASLMDMEMPDGQAYAKDIVRGISKKTTKRKEVHAVNGRLGLVIDGTGKDDNKIKAHKEALEKLGYECSLVFVDTFLETSIERDMQRGKDGGRSLGSKAVTSMWKDVQSNKKSYSSLFGKRFFIIENNSTGKDDKDGNVQFDQQINKITRKISSWANQLPNKPQVKAWMNAN
jgi:shikimate kinase